MENVLRDLQDLNTIAIPGINMGKRYPPSVTAEVIIGAILSFLSNRPACEIREVIIAISPRCKHVLKVKNIIIMRNFIRQHLCQCSANALHLRDWCSIRNQLPCKWVRLEIHVYQICFFVQISLIKRPGFKFWLGYFGKVVFSQLFIILRCVRLD